MNDIEKFRNHIGQGKKVMIGEDEFYFKPLTVRYLPDMMELAAIAEKDEKALMKRENAEKLFTLLKNFVKNSYPQLDDETLEGFVATNLVLIQETMVELSQNVGGNLTSEQKSRIEEMKKNVQSTTKKD